MILNRIYISFAVFCEFILSLNSLCFLLLTVRHLLTTLVLTISQTVRAICSTHLLKCVTRTTLQLVLSLVTSARRIGMYQNPSETSINVAINGIFGILVPSWRHVSTRKQTDLNKNGQCEYLLLVKMAHTLT